MKDNYTKLSVIYEHGNGKAGKLIDFNNIKNSLQMVLWKQR